jgi:hypothetical protein
VAITLVVIFVFVALVIILVDSFKKVELCRH